MLKKRRELIRKEYNKCIKSVKFPKDLIDTYIKAYISLKDVDFTLIFTDFYMICRMFINFDKNKKTPKGCPTKGKNNYITPKYSIIYAGYAHIQDLLYFIKRMFDNVKPVYTTRGKFFKNKTIHVNDCRDINGNKIDELNSVDDLFKDYYE
jgi:hypothetical protein